MRTAPSRLAGLLIGVATAIVIVAVAILPFLTPRGSPSSRTAPQATAWTGYTQPSCGPPRTRSCPTSSSVRRRSTSRSTASRSSTSANRPTCATSGPSSRGLWVLAAHLGRRAGPVASRRRDRARDLARGPARRARSGGRGRRPRGRRARRVRSAVRDLPRDLLPGRVVHVRPARPTGSSSSSRSTSGRRRRSSSASSSSRSRSSSRGSLEGGLPARCRRAPPAATSRRSWSPGREPEHRRVTGDRGGAARAALSASSRRRGTPSLRLPNRSGRNECRVADALGRVIAETAIAGVSLPPWAEFRDGRLRDRGGRYGLSRRGRAGPARDHRRYPAGAEPDVVVRHGTGARIATGAPAPRRRRRGRPGRRRPRRSTRRVDRRTAWT